MSQKPVHILAKWRVKDGQLEVLLSVLMEVVKRSVEEHGNLYYKVHQSNADLYTLLLYEGYANEAALAEHRNSDHFKDLVIGKIVPLLEDCEVTTSTQLMLGLPGINPRHCPSTV